MKMFNGVLTFRPNIFSGFSILILAVITVLPGCEKFIDVDSPVTNPIQEDVFNSDATAIAVLTGLYTRMGSEIISGSTSVSLNAGLSSDEYSLYPNSSNTSRNLFYTNALTAALTPEPDFWKMLYSYIYVANGAIEGLESSSELTPAIKSQLLGESRFIRAFSYFYLVNFYGNVPLVTSTDYTVNASLPRISKDTIWKQINTDLELAISSLSTDYLDGSLINTTGERIRPNKSVATALLARAYLYQGKWNEAEEMSSIIINDKDNYDTTALNDVFLKDSKEAIWQMPSTFEGVNTLDALVFILPESGPNDNDFSVYLSESLMDAFENDDNRKTTWVNHVITDGMVYNYAYKYKVNALPSPVTESAVILRVSEQYLIRAEARAQRGNVSGAAEDVNVIRTRAGLLEIAATPDILLSITRERRVELFSEWGHRWLDLKRSGTIDSIMDVETVRKGNIWKSTQQLYPIPPNDISRNGNLIQNPGYN